jgi:hypothetical protein
MVISSTSSLLILILYITIVHGFTMSRTMTIRANSKKVLEGEGKGLSIFRKSNDNFLEVRDTRK